MSKKVRADQPKTDAKPNNPAGNNLDRQFEAGFLAGVMFALNLQMASIKNIGEIAAARIEQLARDAKGSTIQ